MSAERVSRELRHDTDGYLAQRRGIVALSLAAIGTLSVVALYQTGITTHVPEPPLPGFDADRVDATPDAYRLLRTPDAVLGIGSYAATMALASMGGAQRSRRQRWLPLLLTAKALFDTAQAARLTWTQWSHHRAFCFWCLLTALATWAALPLTLPEARAALHRRS